MLGCYLELDIFIPISSFFFDYSHSVHYKLGVLKGVIKKQAIQNVLEFNFRGPGQVFLPVTLNLLLVVDCNSILSQQIVGEHNSAVTGTCSLLTYRILCFKYYCTKG